MRALAPAIVAAACSTLSPDTSPLMRHMTRRQASALTAAWQAARAAASLPSCQLAVSGKADDSYHNAVYYSLWIGTEYAPLQKPCSQYDLIAYTIPQTSVVVLCPAFFDLPPNARVLIILHEAMHVLGRAHHSQQEANEWDRTIYEECLLPYLNQLKQEDKQMQRMRNREIH